MKHTANARFAIKSWEEKPYNESTDLPKLTRASVSKTYTGDIAGEAHVEYLMMYRSDGSATFVGLERVVVDTLETTPKGATHWSTREMARHVGISHSTVGRIWRAFGLAPHRSETFTLSKDPLFVEKVRDIVGLYLNPPERALVLCVDEKSQIQALDRTQPLLPLRPGQAERRTHDYKRHGTTSLFAVLDVKAGTIIGKCLPRHRALEFRRFLDTVELNVPAELDVHVVMDNASSHKTQLIRSWFAKRPRWHVHYTPTSSSWINQVERFFGWLTDDQIRRSAHRSTAESRSALVSSPGLAVWMAPSASLRRSTTAGLSWRSTTTGLTPGPATVLACASSGTSAVTSCPCSCNSASTWDPMKPVAPVSATFMAGPPCGSVVRRY